MFKTYHTQTVAMQIINVNKTNSPQMPDTIYTASW